MVILGQAATAAYAWVLMTCTVPFDTTSTGVVGPPFYETRNVYGCVATCATVDSVERSLPLCGDSLGGPLAIRDSGKTQRMWIRIPADRRARLVWVRFFDYPAPHSNIAPKSNAFAAIAGLKDTIVYAVAGPLLDNAREAKWTVASARDLAVRVATFSFRDSFPQQPPWLVGPAFPPLMWFDELLTQIKPSLCEVFHHYAQAGQNWACP